MDYFIRTITPRDSDPYQVVIRSDGAQIPMTEANLDYRVYLEWVAEGNTPGEWSEE